MLSRKRGFCGISVLADGYVLFDITVSDVKLKALCIIYIYIYGTLVGNQ